MGFEHIRSWYELEEINDQQERMITAYEIKIKQLEQENAELKPVSYTHLTLPTIYSV